MLLCFVGGGGGCRVKVCLNNNSSSLLTHERGQREFEWANPGRVHKVVRTAQHRPRASEVFAHFCSALEWDEIHLRSLSGSSISFHSPALSCGPGYMCLFRTLRFLLSLIIAVCIRPTLFGAKFAFWFGVIISFDAFHPIATLTIKGFEMGITILRMINIDLVRLFHFFIFNYSCVKW